MPTEAEEQARSVSRQREQHRKRLAAQGLSCARYYGHDVPDEWWRAKKFELLRAELPEFLCTLLESVQRIALLVPGELEALSADVESAQAQELPTDLGALTAQILDREIGDWDRFKNRRQVASYTGLVPSEHSSGQRRQRGAITKHGNPRVRHILIEASGGCSNSSPTIARSNCVRPPSIRPSARAASRRARNSAPAWRGSSSSTGGASAPAARRPRSSACK